MINGKTTSGADTSKFAKKVDLASLKSNVDKLGINKLKNVPTGLKSLKSKVNKLDVDKLVPVPVDKLCSKKWCHYNAKDVNNAKNKHFENEVSDITNLAANTTPNAKINEAKGKIPIINNWVTNAFVKAKINEVKNKMLSFTNVATNTALTAVYYHYKYIPNQ